MISLLTPQRTTPKKVRFKTPRREMFHVEHNNDAALAQFFQDESMYLNREASIHIAKDNYTVSNPMFDGMAQCVRIAHYIRKSMAWVLK